MRIIHSVDSNAEKEYIKTFFNYVGLLVYDETIFKDDYREWSEHLKKVNDNDGVDVVLNYYGEDYYSYDSNRIYLYFDIKKKICKISTSPLSSQKDLYLVQTLNDLLNDGNTNVFKRNTRIKALDLLINEIWKGDVINRISIKKIRECYVPDNEDRDLFYVLQAIDCYKIVFNSIALNDENISTKNISLSKYVIKMIDELWKMDTLLKANINPYVIYTKINNSSLLLYLYNKLNDIDKNLYKEPIFKLDSYDNLYNKTLEFQAKYPWFIGAYFKLIWFKKNDLYKNDDVINELLYFSKESLFPAYFSEIYNLIGKKVYTLCNEISCFKEASKWFKKTLQIDPLNLDANYCFARINTLEGYLIAGDNIIRRILYIRNMYEHHLDIDTNHTFLSFDEVLFALTAKVWLAKIALSSNKEYSMKSLVTNAYLDAEEFEEAKIISMVADKSEKPYQDFIQYHKNSVPVYDLYLILKPWDECISNDETIRKALRRKLDKWKS